VEAAPAGAPPPAEGPGPGPGPEQQDQGSSRRLQQEGGAAPLADGAAAQAAAQAPAGLAGVGPVAAPPAPGPNVQCLSYFCCGGSPSRAPDVAAPPPGDGGRLGSAGQPAAQDPGVTALDGQDQGDSLSESPGPSAAGGGAGGAAPGTGGDSSSAGGDGNGTAPGVWSVGELLPVVQPMVTASSRQAQEEAAPGVASAAAAAGSGQGNSTASPADGDSSSSASILGSSSSNSNSSSPGVPPAAAIGGSLAAVVALLTGTGLALLWRRRRRAAASAAPTLVRSTSDGAASGLGDLATPASAALADGAGSSRGSPLRALSMPPAGGWVAVLAAGGQLPPLRHASGASGAPLLQPATPSTVGSSRPDRAGSGSSTWLAAAQHLQGRLALQQRPAAPPLHRHASLPHPLPSLQPGAPAHQNAPAGAAGLGAHLADGAGAAQQGRLLSLGSSGGRSGGAGGSGGGGPGLLQQLTPLAWVQEDGMSSRTSWDSTTAAARQLSEQQLLEGQPVGSCASACTSPGASARPF